MAFDNLLLERDDAIAIVTINRPRVLNALDRATLDELRRAMVDLRQDQTVRAIVITGSGERAFAAGADIRELADQSPAGLREQARAGQHVFALIERLGKPVIAAINGYALGGGCELAMACTLRLAADTAQLGQPEIMLGLIPGYGGTQRLPRLVGRGRALQLLLLGSPVGAVEAERIGLVNRVVPQARLLPEARALATTLADRAPLATELLLEAVHRGSELPLDEGSALEAGLFGLAGASDDMREGTRAFLEKRAPVFRGR